MIGSTTNDLIAALREPGAYPFAAERVHFIQTHISLVFLVSGYAYKVKKPVSLGFLDFSTLEKRKHFCEEEVRLNRRLAPSVYLGIVPITLDNGRLRMEGSGEPIEWAVKMVRLPADATLESRVDSGLANGGEMIELAGRIADFHKGALGSIEIARFGAFDIVARNARENFEQARPEIGTTVHPGVFERLRVLTDKELNRLRPLIESRAARGVSRDTHGDLHLDHVYHFPDRPSPDNWAIVDCIEFNERFRYADPVADMAFLVMDLKFHNRPDLARSFADAWFKKTGDGDGRDLLSFYIAYRSIVRAKVGGIKLRTATIGKRERADELMRAQAHWLLALAELEEQIHRPYLLFIGGLPGTGKSTLALQLAERNNFEVIRSDVLRKELARSLPTANLYTPEWNERTYAECLRQAEVLLFAGMRVIVDATFRQEQHRLMFANAARQRCVEVLWFDCEADPEVARQRIAARRNDPSDATWDVYQRLAANWEPPSATTQVIRRVIRTDLAPDDAVRDAESYL